MARLNQDRQKRLEPLRMEAAQIALEKLGYEVQVIGTAQLRFEHQGKTVSYYPYSGWASGSTIRDGRGLKKLLNQLNMELKPAYISNCCGASITQADPQGHGKCDECGENCVPEIEEAEVISVTTIPTETVTGIEQDIPDLSWSMVFSIVFYFLLYNFLIDNFHHFL